MTTYNITKSPDSKTLIRTYRSALMKATPNQVENWVDNNVTDLASAKQLLKVMAVIVTQLAQKEWGNG